MRFAKYVNGSATRFCRVKRKGTKNCRVVWLDSHEEQLLPIMSVHECTAEEAGVGRPDTGHANADPGDSLPGEAAPLTGAELCRAMRNFQVSAKELAARLGVTTEQIREARNAGISDSSTAASWLAAIQSQPELATA